MWQALAAGTSTVPIVSADFRCPVKQLMIKWSDGIDTHDALLRIAVTNACFDSGTLPCTTTHRPLHATVCGGGGRVSAKQKI